MSKSLNIALTGPPGIGKTTYIQKLAKSLNERGIPCCGFLTEEVRGSNKERIGFDVISLDGKRGVLARTNVSGATSMSKSSASSFMVGKYSVDVKAFEAVVLPLFNEIPKSSVIVIDEIGKMEMFSSKFVQKVKEIISTSEHRMIISRTNRDDCQMFEDLLNFFIS
ncbi:Cancer-related nucleoside-triphosphatase-like protein [Armadillidium nasatum]|uniref:Cancer-related nucleoside-triphosphatase-like protein n=1 Tax=Armadillidium nasatum TaxID=96803 RepID=A0A5N5SK97_9CRUS|nr:Cancer-related nucleoside-triphosphatase-like protein [Armadillidium nasatum]